MLHDGFHLGGLTHGIEPLTSSGPGKGAGGGLRWAGLGLEACGEGGALGGRYGGELGGRLSRRLKYLPLEAPARLRISNASQKPRNIVPRACYWGLRMPEATCSVQTVCFQGL